MNAYLTKDILYDIRIEFRKNLDIKSSYLAESIASGYGYKTSISMLEDIKKKDVLLSDMNYFSFIERLKDFYPDITTNEVIPVLMKIIKKQSEGLQNFEYASTYGLYKKYIINDNDSFIVNGQAYIKTPEYLDQKDRRCVNLWSNNDDAPLKYIIETGQIETDSAFYLNCDFMGYLFSHLYRYDAYPLLSIEYSIANLDISTIIDTMFRQSSFSYNGQADWEKEMLRSKILITFKKIKDLLNNHNIVESLAAFVSPVCTYTYEVIFNSMTRNQTKEDIIHMIACYNRDAILYSINKEKCSFINERYWFTVDIMLVCLFIKLSTVNLNHQLLQKPEYSNLFEIKTLSIQDIFPISETRECPEYLKSIVNRFNVYKQIMKEKNISLLDVLNLLIGRKQENIETSNFFTNDEMMRVIQESF